MKDLIEALDELQNTPVPLILGVVGIAFLLRVLAARFAGKMETPHRGRQRWAVGIGFLLLLAGIALYAMPGLESGSTPTVSSDLPSITPRSTVTLVPNYPEIPVIKPVGTPTLPPDISPPKPTKTDTPPPTFKPKAQQVGWGPAFYQRKAGICVNNCAEFIPWVELKEELQQQLLPQLSWAPKGSTIGLKDQPGKQDWIVQVLDPNRNEIGHVWFGPDPSNNWAFDGLVRVGNPIPPVIIRDTFQRYSDRSYKRQ
ncbi:MAG: hypothetical protein AB1797_08590 [bacterium]